jgi:dienelactone hydrolase
VFKSLSVASFCLFASFWFVPYSSAADPVALPDTKPLTEEGNLSEKQVAGMHKYLDRELAAAPKKRDELWRKLDDAKRRAGLKKMLGLTDARVAPRMEYVSGPGEPAVIAESETVTAYAVRWTVLPGVDGEGILLEPRGKVKTNVVAVPDATWTPEQIAGLVTDEKGPQPFAKRLAEHGCRVVIPVLINRKDDLSGNPKLNRSTNLPHREFVHRMAYEMGRTLVGYEVQKVLGAVDWFQAQDKKLPVGVIGVGEGGRVALYAAAADERVRALHVACAFGPREGVHEEPLDRNLWNEVREFGDAEVASLVTHQSDFVPRVTVYPAGPKVDVPAGTWPEWAGPNTKAGKGAAAPGTIRAIPADDTAREYKRFIGLLPPTGRVFGKVDGADNAYGYRDLLHTLQQDGFAPADQPAHALAEKRKDFDPGPRHKRQFDQLVAFTQKLWRDSEATRKAFWSKANPSSLETWEKSCEWYRDYFHTEVIGKLPEPTVPLNPRTRRVYDEKTWTGYEVVLDVYDDVFAYGILLLPKDLKPGEKRPVVVCQHGLEGTPRDTIEVEKRPVYNHFSRRLVELGYIVYAPQNPYYGRTVFRQLQRKANPLSLSLFSFIIRQHQRTIDWLEALPNVDPRRIAFYGLSYGGKTAMRVPAVEKRYCLSICSGDFNEWIGKNVSVDLDRSYMWTLEYEMYEFDLGNTFNYAEMAYLIAPRPFMVERGHDDGVGIDEMVAHEYARVRYLYANRLKIPERTTIEWFVGGHQVNARGTFEFLKQKLEFPK